MTFRSIIFAFALFLMASTILVGQTIHGIYVQDKYAPGTFPISVVLKGSNPVNSVTVEWNLNGEGLQSETVTNIDSYTEQSTTYHSFQTSGGFTVDAYENNHLEVWVTNINGMGGSTAVTDLYFDRSLQTTDRKVYLEEITATWCGFCPEGHYIKQQLKAEYPDRLLAASLHKDDAMESAASDEVVTAYGAAQPRGMFNRNNFPNTNETSIISSGVLHHQYDWDDLLRLELTKTAVVATNVSTTYNSSTRALTVNADWTFLEDLSGNYRVNCYINQETFSSSSNSYNQANYYGSDANSPFFGLPNSINGYQHTDWAREMLSGAWGASGVIPASVSKGDVINHNWSYTIPTSFNTNTLYVVVTIQEYGSTVNERNILNALDCGLNASNTQAVVDHETTTNFVFNPQILLEGPYSSAGSMSPQLGNLIPNGQPFTGAPYNYNGAEFYSNIPIKAVDWLLIEVREGTPNLSGSKGTTTLDRKAVLVRDDGRLISPDGSMGVSFKNLARDKDYYFVIRHRNHLDVMTGLATTGDDNMEYDMRTSATSAWGIEQLVDLGDGFFAMHAGDFNQDAVIQTTDYDVWNLEPAALNVYQAADADLNGVIQTTDFDAWQKNKAKIGNVEVNY